MRDAADYLIEKEDATVVRDLLARIPEDVKDAVLRWVDSERQKERHDVQESTLRWLTYVLAWALFPAKESKAWGIVYALDLEHIHKNVPPGRQAKKIHITRAAISYAMQEAARVLQVPQSRWLRGEKALQSSSRARKRVCS